VALWTDIDAFLLKELGGPDGAGAQPQAPGATK